MVNYRWKITSRADQLILELEAVKLLLDSLPQQLYQESFLRQKSLLKSSVYSARIEGLPDTVDSPKKASQNLLFAYRLIFANRSPRRLSLPFIHKLHRLVLRSLSTSAGHWRHEPWAIFNQAGVAVYLAPFFSDLPQLMNEYIRFLDRLTIHPAVKAAIAQFIFEKIHPYADGNGRVGRLVSAFVLDRHGYGLRGLAPLEEYLE